MNEVNNLIEEIFCLKYELNTLANVVLRNETERWVPGFLHEKTEHSHIERYKLACTYSNGRNVIDIACGIGKGSYLIATEGKANIVNGFDIQEDAIRYASWRNSNENIKFSIKDAEALGITNEYDLAISFETVEHLPNYRNFLVNIANCLKPGGLFLISTPISNLPVNKKPVNPYHIQEWGFIEFQRILQEFFDIEKVYVQFYPKRATVKPHKPPIFYRIFDKIRGKVFGNNDNPVAVNDNKPVENFFSKIEEFTGQYNIEEFGTSKTGYQIVLAKRKDV